MSASIENTTEIGMSANAKDFQSAIQWIQLQRAKGNRIAIIYFDPYEI